MKQSDNCHLCKQFIYASTGGAIYASTGGIYASTGGVVWSCVESFHGEPYVCQKCCRTMHSTSELVVAIMHGCFFFFFLFPYIISLLQNGFLGSPWSQHMGTSVAVKKLTNIYGVRAHTKRPGGCVSACPRWTCTI